MKAFIAQPTAAEIKFSTYLFYLESISRFLDLQYGDWDGLALACATKVKALAPLPTFDQTYVERHLRLAWNTECLLYSGPDDIDLMRIANQWAPVQAYYAVYTAGEALAYLLDGIQIGAHKKTLRKLTEHLIKTGLPPWNHAYRGPIGKPPGQQKPVNLPADLALPSNLQRQNVRPIQMLAKCLKAEHGHRVDDNWKKRPRQYKYKFDPGPTGLLHFLYRLRLKSNYKEVDLFIARAQNHEVKAFADHLRRFTSATLTCFEIAVARKSSKKALLDAATAYLKDNKAAKSLEARARSYDALL